MRSPRFPTLFCLLVALGAAAVAHADAIGPLHCNDSAGAPRMKGKTVTVIGIVTGQFSTEKNTRLYLQDATGGINVFGSPRNCAPIGDSLRVTGAVGSYNGLTEITGTDEHPLTIEVLDHTRPLPAPLELTPEWFNAAPDSNGCEPNESRLVEVHNLMVRTSTGEIPAPGAVFVAGANYRLSHAAPDSATSFVTLRIEPASSCESNGSLENVAIPDGTVRAVGILSQFKGRSARSVGYQLLARTRDDLTPETGGAGGHN